MEKLMIRAIRQFKKEHKNAEIRTCEFYWGCVRFGKTISATFHIEYVEVDGGEYKKVYIAVSKGDK